MKKIKVIIDPAFFEKFEGTQEELDAIVKEVEEKFANGDFSEYIDLLDDIVEDMTEEELEELENQLNGDQDPPTLH